MSDQRAPAVSETISFDCPKCGPQEYLVCLSEPVNKQERDVLVYTFKMLHRRRHHGER